MLAVAKLVLLAAGHALDDRIDGFEMARIARKLDAYIAAGLRFADADGSLVIFHIAFVGREARDATCLRKQ